MDPTTTVLFTSVGRSHRYVISRLLSSDSCPTIRIITKSFPNMYSSFPPQLLKAPHSIIVLEHFTGKSFEESFSGVDIVFHDGLPVHPTEDEALNASVVDAARNAAVRHFIFLSVLQPMRLKLPTNKSKLSMEEYLTESRVDYTILQPPHLMQNIDLKEAVSKGEFPIGFSSSIEHGFVDMVDVATVVQDIIADPKKHRLARYELVSENVTYDQIARMITKVSGKLVKCKAIPPKEFIRKMKDLGDIRNEHAEDTMIRLMVYYDRWGLDGNSNTLRWLLNREPTTWEAYLHRELRKLYPDSGRA